jgi:2-polyprenyl-3-methyl-5-hydroxy-6-metoxy-1,4-benzoquinol methylase
MGASSAYRSHKACLITGAEDLVPLKGYEKDYLVKSKSSGFVFSSRIPELSELQKHYVDYPRVTELPELTKKRYAALLDRFEEFRGSSNILDVGCGNGLFLIEAKERGWNVFGTEFTDDAVEFCKSNGIDMKKGPLNPSDFEAGQFDIVTSFEVIEHINNPLEESLNFHQLLRKGGLLYITTPNFNCVERFILGPSYDIIEYPEHLCYYSSRTLQLLIESKGFRTLQIEAVNIDFAKLFRGESASQLPGKVNNDVRENFESNPILRMLKSSLNFVLSKAKLGNALKGWFVKQ